MRGAEENFTERHDHRTLNIVGCIRWYNGENSMVPGLIPLSMHMSTSMLEVVLLVIEDRAHGRRQVAFPVGIALAASQALRIERDDAHHFVPSTASGAAHIVRPLSQVRCASTHVGRDRGASAQPSSPRPSAV